MKALAGKLHSGFQLLCAAASVLLVNTAYAADHVEPHALSAPEIQSRSPNQASTQSLSYTLADLGQRNNIKIVGADGSYSVALLMPNKIVPDTAQLKLKYHHSDELLSGLSHLNVRIDGKHVATIPVKQDDAGQELSYNVELPARWITPESRLDLQLIGHYTNRCENPRYSGLWLEVDNTSTLDLEARPNLANPRLDDLPVPFFRGNSIAQLVLPFVLPASPDAETLEAAGIVSSWFGALADYRGAKFPVNHDKLPETGDAVIVLSADESINGLELPAVKGPEVGVFTHPSDPTASLLVIRGKNQTEVKQAAQALVLGDKALTGKQAYISALDLPEPRLPYDAPRWLSRHNPVAFGNLQAPANLQVNGFSPDLIRFGVRLPPDLYDPDDVGALIKLVYHYTPRPKSDASRLLSSANGIPLGVIDLKPAGNPDTATLSLPVRTLASQTELQFYFDYNYLSRENCKDVPADTVRGRIDPSSTIDISHLPHFIAMPNMAAFANSGFPFTRLADLSETAFVLPQQSGTEEQTTYLNILGQMGAATGYPAIRLQVVFPQPNTPLPNKDILVIAGSNIHDVLGPWSSALPKNSVLENGQDQENSSLWKKLIAYVDPSTSTQPHRQLNHQALLTGFESPASAGRSVVVVASANPSNLHHFSDALLNTSLLERIRGSSISLGADQVQTLSTQTDYYLTDLSLPHRIVWYLERHPLILVMLALITTVILGLMMYATLRARAIKRLRQ
ncbi:cellulose biosynthesis cyclic di-GMP-binding regulatory protein BcsB [Pusillimonas sp. NJUB218]|uniref:cellulose biosynthesis cyclic di-GMP-binding regulatory protein BcsB n=1 Tax=Pusillimonas sp. NJUB218 TaxID=2023230 RepID=UPI000F4B378E|nr:cellulose biosynthesis cyclic di-GMP-binding regulatory protein BcsB [Pusillimonas sp. NJUB218]ROT44744.1 hypothetical protein CHR62_09910 [Pusillimonas sp. NJUB218]